MKQASLRCGIDAPWPIIARQTTVLSSQDIQRLSHFAETRIKADAALDNKWFEHEGVHAGWAPGPTLYLEDHRAIALTTEEDAKSFEYRSLGLAGDNDFFIVSAPRNFAFENYMRDIAKLGAPHIIELPVSSVHDAHSLAKAAVTNSYAMEALTAAAKRYGTLNIIPFISTGDVWVLARVIAKESGVRIYVAAPPPVLARYANNKIWFSALVRELLGANALPFVEEAHNLTQLAGKLCRLACAADMLVVKAPSSAGSMGNVQFSTSILRHSSPLAAMKLIDDQFKAKGLRKTFPLQIGVWEGRALSSPSVQLWAPAISKGPPVIEGVFIQNMSDDDNAFQGADLAALPEDTLAELEKGALQIAVVLQQMGYFGRLSLDAILLETHDGRNSIKWIEANARWGGVSIPLTILHRAALSRVAFSILQRKQKKKPQKTGPEIYEALKPVLLNAKAVSKSRTILLTPPDSSHLCLLVIDASEKSVAQIIRKVSKALLA